MSAYECRATLIEQERHMSDASSGKRMGFASLFSNTKELVSDIPTPARSPSLKPAKALHGQDKAGALTETSHHSPSSAVRTKHGSSDKRRDGKPSSTKHRNYRCVKDPDLDKTMPKGSKPVLKYSTHEVRYRWHIAMFSCSTNCISMSAIA